jgi:hypothetical protein
MDQQQNTNRSAPRALRAEEAGRVLAGLVGMDTPISPAKMWRYARQGLVPTVRLGRLRYFRTIDLEKFVANGGCGFEPAGRRV